MKTFIFLAFALFFFEGTQGLYIKALHSGKCVDLRGGSKSNGGEIQQYNCVSGTTNQQWDLLPQKELVHGNPYYLVRVKTSGKCLDIPLSSTADSVLVKQWDCIPGRANQMFRLVNYYGDTPNGYYRFVAKHSGKCLDVRTGGSADELRVVQYTCVKGAKNQMFFPAPQANSVVPVPNDNELKECRDKLINIDSQVNGCSDELKRCGQDTAGQQQKLDLCVNEAKNSQLQLSECSDSLTSSKDSLNACVSEGHVCKNELNTCKVESNSCLEELDGERNATKSCQAQSALCVQELDIEKSRTEVCKKDTKLCRGELDISDQKLDLCQDRLKLCQAGSRETVPILGNELEYVTHEPVVVYESESVTQSSDDIESEGVEASTSVPFSTSYVRTTYV